MAEHALRQRLPAVDGQGLAGDVRRSVGEQEERAERLHVVSVVNLRAGISASICSRISGVGNRRSAARLAVERARAMQFTQCRAAPAISTASEAREIQTAGLRRGRVRRHRVAVPGIGGDHVQHRPADAVVPHAPRDRARAIERAVQDDVDDGPPAVRREVDRMGQEVAGGVVDQPPRRSETPRPPPQPRRPRAPGRARRPAWPVPRRRARGRAPRSPRSARSAAADGDRRAALGQRERERPPHAGAAPGDQRRAPLESAHSAPPSWSSRAR